MFCGSCGAYHEGPCSVMEELILLEEFEGGGRGRGRIGIDVTDGDPVVDMGDGFGIDARTGELELDLGGFDIPLN